MQCMCVADRVGVRGAAARPLEMASSGISESGAGAHAPIWQKV